RDVLPHHRGALGAAVRLGQLGGLGQLRGRARRGAHLDRLDGADGEVRRVRLEHALVLLAGDRHDRAVAGPAAVAVLRELRRGHLLADHLPGGGVGEVVRGHRDVVVRAAVVVRLVGEEVVLVAVHVALVRGEQRGARALGEGAAVAVGLAGADLGAELDPFVVGPRGGGVLALDGGEEIRRALLAQGHGPLVLVHAVVVALVLGDGDVDRAGTGLAAAVHVDPHLRLGGGHEVVGGRVHHPVVGGGGALGGIGRVVEVRGPVHDVGAALLVPVGLGRPGVPGVLVADHDVALLGPVHEIGGLPHLHGEGAVLLRP